MTSTESTTTPIPDFHDSLQDVGWSVFIGALWQGLVFVIFSAPWLWPDRWNRAKEEAKRQGYFVTGAGKMSVNGWYQRVKKDRYEQVEDAWGNKVPGERCWMLYSDGEWKLTEKISDSSCIIDRVVYNGKVRVDINEPEDPEDPQPKRHGSPANVLWELNTSAYPAQDSARLPSVREHTSSVLANCIPELEPHEKRVFEGEVKDNAAVKIYLSFLVMYRNLFWVLTIISFFFVAPTWGFRPFFVFFPEKGDGNYNDAVSFIVSIAGDVDLTGLQTLCSTTILTTLIALLYALKFQQDCNRSHKETLWHMRAGWFKEIPVKDQATLQPHTVTLDVLSRVVQKDLKEAINDKLNKCEEDEEAQKSAVTCPIGNCPVNLGVCGCQLACTLVFTCCQFKKNEAPLVEEHKSPALKLHRQKSPGSPSALEDHVDEIFVQPVMEKYVQHIKHYKRIKKFEERIQAYQWKTSHSKPAEDFLLQRPRTWYPHLRHLVYRQKLQYSQTNYGDARKEFLSLEKNPERVKLEMSGHAFVVFKEESDLDRMLQTARQWNDFRDYNDFQFGRPPFSSVTLQCRHAPHPTDISWEHLHIPFCPNYLLHMLNVSLLIVVTVAVVAAISVFDNIDEFLSVLSTLEGWIGPWLARFRQYASRNTFIFGNLPTILLLTFNSIGVPFWIDAIAHWRRYMLRSWGEMLQLNLNFVVLILSKMVFPFIAFVIIGKFQLDNPSCANNVCKHASEGSPDNRFRVLSNVFAPPINVMGRSGNFYLKYCLNCTFLSNAITLTQLARILCRRVQLSCFSVTRSEKRDSNQCFVWPWGYWYAWSLTIAANGLIFGIIVPSMLPVTALNFTLKHFVDRELLENGEFNPGPSSMGIYAPRVVHLMIVIVAAKAATMGAGMILLQLSCEKGDCINNGICCNQGLAFCQWWGVILIAASVVIAVISQISKLQQSLEEGLKKQFDTLITTIGDCVLSWYSSTTRFGRSEPLLAGDVRAEDRKQEEEYRKQQERNRQEKLSWDAREHALQALMEKEHDDELRNTLCLLLGMQWDKAKGIIRKIDLGESQQERQERIEAGKAKNMPRFEEQTRERLEELNKFNKHQTLGMATMPVIDVMRMTDAGRAVTDSPCMPLLQRALTANPKLDAVGQDRVETTPAARCKSSPNSTRSASPASDFVGVRFSEEDVLLTSARESVASGLATSRGISSANKPHSAPATVSPSPMRTREPQQESMDNLGSAYGQQQVSHGSPTDLSKTAKEVQPPVVHRTLSDRILSMPTRPAPSNTPVEAQTSKGPKMFSLDEFAQPDLSKAAVEAQTSEVPEISFDLVLDQPAQLHQSETVMDVQTHEMPEIVSDPVADQLVQPDLSDTTVEVQTHEVPATSSAPVSDQPAQAGLTEAAAEVQTSDVPETSSALVSDQPVQPNLSETAVEVQMHEVRETLSDPVSDQPAQPDLSATPVDVQTPEVPETLVDAVSDQPDQSETALDVQTSKGLETLSDPVSDQPAQPDLSDIAVEVQESERPETSDPTLNQLAKPDQSETVVEVQASASPETSSNPILDQGSQPDLADAAVDLHTSERPETPSDPTLEHSAHLDPSETAVEGKADVVETAVEVQASDRPDTSDPILEQPSQLDLSETEVEVHQSQETDTIQEVIAQLVNTQMDLANSAPSMRNMGMPEPGQVTGTARNETPPHEGPITKGSQYYRKEVSAPGDMREPVESANQSRTGNSAPPRSIHRDKSGLKAKKNSPLAKSARGAQGSPQTLIKVDENATLAIPGATADMSVLPASAAEVTTPEVGADTPTFGEQATLDQQSSSTSRSSETPESRQGTPEVRSGRSKKKNRKSDR